MNDQEMEAIAGGYHGDPFSVLGPHALTGNGKVEWEIRAFLPQAKQVELAIDGKHIPMEKAHTAGIFATQQTLSMRGSQPAALFGDTDGDYLVLIFVDGVQHRRG